MVITLERFLIINAVDYYIDHFTCSPNEGFIEMKNGVNEFLNYD